MNNTQFMAEGGVDIITKALDDFLRHKRLSLSTQQYSRLKKLLMVSLLDQDISYSAAYNQLSTLMEYRKDYDIDANAPDEAEEEMIRIIGAADVAETTVIVETTKFKKRFIVAACLLVVFFGALIAMKAVENYRQSAIKMASVISNDQAEDLKNLVEQIVDIEKLNGRDITPNAIYAQMKKLESVQTAGNATSYKKFNNAQLMAATEFLNGWVADIQPAAGEPSADQLNEIAP